MSSVTTAGRPAKLEDRVGSAIRKSPFLSGRKLFIETEGGRVILQGEVGTFFQKQMAQEAVRYVDGVLEIDNRLIVDWH